MEVKNFKSNKPELLVDLNGNAIQAWPLGGITIEVEGRFIARSSLIRVTNISSNPARLSRLLSGLTINDDVGLPILSQSSEYFACEIGDEFMVRGDGLYITFLRSNADLPPQRVPSGSTFNYISFLGNESIFEPQDKQTGIISGYIDYCYDPLMLGHWAEVKIDLASKTPFYPNFTCIIEKEGGVVNRFKPDGNIITQIDIRIPITRPGETILIKLDWLGTGITDDVLTIKVDESTILRNG